jgi:uncharacterized Tic20 family protein
MTTPTPWSAIPRILNAEQERTWAMVSHLSTIPAGFIGPMLVWAAGKDRSPFVDNQGKEALNFGIDITIGYAVSTVLLTLSFLNPWLAAAGAIGYVIFGLASVVLAARGARAAYRGELHRYPFAIRFIG